MRGTLPCPDSRQGSLVPSNVHAHQLSAQCIIEKDFVKIFYFFVSKPIPVDMSGPTATLVKELIASDMVVIFSKTYCPYCTMAKEVFDKLSQKYTTIELDKRDDGDTIQAILGEMTGAKSVPRVFVKGECIGGGTDCKSLMASGKLQPMLA